MCKVWRLKPAVHSIFWKSSLLQGMANLRFSLKDRQIQRGLTLRGWLLARWLRDHARRGIALKAYRCFFSEKLSAYLSNKYWAAWLSWRISWRKQRAENFLLKFATDLFPGLTSRVSLFNVNVLNHKDKLSGKMVQIKFRMYSQ